MKAVYDMAAEYIGLKEFPGARDNAAIVEMFADVGHSWVKDDETAWCAAFVGAVLARCGLPHTRALNARSYLDWGAPVALADAQLGDVVIFWREDPSSWKGHVGFFAGLDGSRVLVLGGNQGNAVSVKPYPVQRLLGVRRGREQDVPDVAPPEADTSRAGWGRIVRALAGLFKRDRT